MSHTNNINAIISNSDFIKLDRLLNRFNVFDATDMRRREVKHTKFLAYLLNPNESHGLGDSFLLAFLGRLPLDWVPDICLMLLHTELAEVFAEWGKSKTGKKGQIDLIIKIPMVNEPGRCFIVAVENKIDSKQGAMQLSDYTELLASLEKVSGHVLAKYYLTEQGEEPKKPEDKKEWVAVTYADTVIPAITQILSSRTDKVSDYIQYVLQDYLHLMDDREEEDIEKDLLAQRIGVKQVQSFKPAKDFDLSQASSTQLAWKNLWVKYPKACKYLASYNADPRKLVVNYLKDLKSFDLPEKNLTFEAETTGLSTVKFSILSQDNARQLIVLSSSAQRKWLASYRNLAFEISIRPVVKDDENSDAIDEPIKYSISATFTLGPTILNQAERLALVNDIRASLGDGPLETCTSEFTRLIKPKRLIFSGSEILSGEDLVQWFRENIFTADNGALEIKKKVLDIAIAANIGLNKFFSRPESIELIKNVMHDYVENNVLARHDSLQNEKPHI